MKAFAIASFFFCILLPFAPAAQASDVTALTITPPFFELNVNPGDVWSSSIKVVNSNAVDLPIRASIMGFAPSDDQGHGNFVDLSAVANDADAVANWIVVSNPSVVVPRGSFTDVPFSVVVPKDASPGGHYGAILVGTAPGGAGDAGSHVGVSTYISALIFVRVSGDMKESGDIREFTVDKSLYQTPNVNFEVRFANVGNVHLRPVGDIRIYNAFGKERGKVDVNQGGNLGYVLPSSTRRFSLSWRGESNLLDIGPYTAVVTLAYGENGDKTVSQTVTFWVLPILNIIEVLLSVLMAGALFVFAMRRFTRRMLLREMNRYGGVPRPPSSEAPRIHDRRGDESASRHEAARTVDLRNHREREGE